MVRMMPRTRRMAARFAVVLGLIAPTARAWAQDAETTRVPADPAQGTYRSDRLGIEYQLVPYRGHFGARLTRKPDAGSPFLQVNIGGRAFYLEPNDMIVTLDGQVIDGPRDVESHVQQTTVQFVNARDGALQQGTAMFPGGAGGGGGGGMPNPPSLPESRRVRAVLVVDTLSKLAGLEFDRDRMRSMLEIVDGDGRADVTILEGQDANARGVLNYLRGLGDASSDTVLVYYSGHGATDPGRGHALTFTEGPPLLRSTLRAELARLRPRLTVLISDCCSNVVKLPPAVGAPGAPDPTKTLRSLFLRTYGVVDINASTFDPRTGLEESAWGLADGGIFTKALDETVLMTPFDELDRNRDGLVTWGECLPLVRNKTAGFYADYRQQVLADPGRYPPRTVESLRRQSSQTPQAFSLDSGQGSGGGGGGGGRRELGILFTPVTVFDATAGANVIGARIDTVRAGLPAARVGLEAGDIITLVNGRRFGSSAEFLQLLAQAPGTSVLRIRNVRDGRFLDTQITFGD